MHSHHATLMYSFGKIIYVHNFYNMKICAHSEFYKNDTINVSLCSVSANIFLKTNVVRVLLHFYSSWWVRQMHYNDNMKSKIQRETPKNRIVFVTTIDANEETLKGWSKKRNQNRPFPDSHPSGANFEGNEIFKALHLNRKLPILSMLKWKIHI